MAESFIAGDPLPSLYADTHPAWCAGYGTMRDWLAVGASVIGPGHIRRYRARDDAFVLMGAHDHIVAAVADGVGGQMYSRIGAAHCANFACIEILRQLSVPHVRRQGVDDFDPATLPRQLSTMGVPRTVPNLLPGSPLATPEKNWNSSGTFRWNWSPYRRQFATDLYEDEDPPAAPPTLSEAVERTFAAAHSSLAAHAAMLKLNPLQLSCTLLVVVVDTRTGAAAGGHLGDGAILNAGTLEPALAPPPLTNEGNPFTVPLPDWREGLRVADLSSHNEGWLLLTDGALDFFPKDAASLPHLWDHTDPAQHSLRLLEWLQALQEADCEDDRTIALLTGNRRS